ncbi:MAG: hypothetical protein DRQ63_00820 [Gammaproteobacteria bacterium]|nr:MAG: hypothetical protein DRQ63_00820 [Gammaproteobacteria bacterium]
MSEEMVPDFDINKSVRLIFATPLVVHDWPNSEQFNQDLEKLVRHSEDNDKDGYGTRSNAGGWQSPGNLITWKDPVVDIFRQRIEKLVTNLLQETARDTGKNRSFRLMIDAWANINRDRDYNVVHTHPNCMYSGVYYVHQGEPEKAIPYSGLLEILDPREAANYVQIRHSVFDAREFVENIPGRMLLWPSWLKHWVHPYQGKGERISVAFNVNVIEENEQPA